MSHDLEDPGYEDGGANALVIFYTIVGLIIAFSLVGGILW